MLGAGLVALVQVMFLILRKRPGSTPAGAPQEDKGLRGMAEARRSIGLGSGAYLLIAVLLPCWARSGPRCRRACSWLL